MGLDQYDSLVEYCGSYTASSVFLILFSLSPYVIRSTVTTFKFQSIAFLKKCQYENKFMEHSFSPEINNLGQQVFSFYNIFNILY